MAAQGAAAENAATLESVLENLTAEGAKLGFGPQVEAALPAVRRAWERPPARIHSAGPAAGGKPKTFHFRLGQTHSGPAAAKHQDYIERDGACAASIGNMGGTPGERTQFWKDVAKKSASQRRRGHLKLHPEAPARARAYVLDQQERLQKAGILDSEAMEALKHPENPVTLRTATPEAHRKLRRELIRASLSGLRLPKGITEHKPRSPIVQRRIIVEIAHELSPAAMQAALREWCEQELGPHVNWHAVIHSPENRNDPRNWHGHIVYANFAKVEGGVLPPGKLPLQPEMIRTLSGNGPQKRTGSAQLVRQWRQAMAEIQNRKLREAGEAKRYTALSYKKLGIRIEPGDHRGFRRSALEEKGEATSWEGYRKGWTGGPPGLRILTGLLAHGQDPKSEAYQALRRILAEPAFEDALRAAEQAQRAAGPREDPALLSETRLFMEAPATGGLHRDLAAAKLEKRLSARGAPVPEAIAEAAARNKAATLPWTTRWNAARQDREGRDEDAHALISDMEKAGFPEPGTLLPPRMAKDLGARSLRHIRRIGAAEAFEAGLATLRHATHPDRIPAFEAQHRKAHAKALRENPGMEARQAVRLEKALRAATLRQEGEEALRLAADLQVPRDQVAGQARHLASHPDAPLLEPAERRILEALASGHEGLRDRIAERKERAARMQNARTWAERLPLLAAHRSASQDDPWPQDPAAAEAAQAWEAEERRIEASLQKQDSALMKIALHQDYLEAKRPAEALQLLQAAKSRAAELEAMADEAFEDAAAAIPAQASAIGTISAEAGKRLAALRERQEREDSTLLEDIRRADQGEESQGLALRLTARQLQHLEQRQPGTAKAARRQRDAAARERARAQDRGR